MKKIIILLLLLGLSGCGVVFQNFNEGKYKNLTYGMSKEEVTNTIGAPQKESTLTIEGKEYEAWEYPEMGPEARKYNRLGTAYYKVFFLGGKVVRWDKDKVYAQPSFEFRESPAPEQTVTVINKVSEPEQNLK
jgi:hypothetical protein